MDYAYAYLRESVVILIDGRGEGKCVYEFEMMETVVFAQLLLGYVKNPGDFLCLNGLDGSMDRSLGHNSDSPSSA